MCLRSRSIASHWCFAASLSEVPSFGPSPKVAVGRPVLPSSKNPFDLDGLLALDETGSTGVSRRATHSAATSRPRRTVCVSTGAKLLMREKLVACSLGICDSLRAGDFVGGGA